MNTEKACLGLCRPVPPANQLAAKRLPSFSQAVHLLWLQSSDSGDPSVPTHWKHVGAKGFSQAADALQRHMHRGAQRMSSSTSCPHLGSQLQGTHQGCFLPPCREETRGSKPLINVVTQCAADGLVPHADQHEQGQQPLCHRDTREASKTCPRSCQPLSQLET